MAVTHYPVDKMLVAVDCVIFGFDGEKLKLLLIKRGFEPQMNKWSLMGGFVRPKESLDNAAIRILEQLTGLKGVFMEQLAAFGDPSRDPMERTISVVYYALVDIGRYRKQLSEDFHAEWFPMAAIPLLIFDHQQMVERARERLQYKAALHPILFELLPERFTIRQLLDLYEAVYGKELDKRNFVRKLKSSGLIIRQKEKEKASSKKGSFLFKPDKRKYPSSLRSFISFLPNKEIFQ
ncbi:NUDIX hydrolase [Pseudoflavitalea rhizosphaerae]|uniref:NUDIX hydrolase n=1 Tax=Pseudoflavitalea rhizosphaerae TaxID=1884793 RepID=UPI000F8C6463|nr:NUDIX domain-containing protein [Pseudoflavitalea rhizosphaerae]